MPVMLRRKKRADGSDSLYLDIYFSGERRYEFLKMYMMKTKTPIDREQNKKTLQIAESIRAKRELQVNSDEYDLPNNHLRNASFNAVFQKYVDDYIDKDKRKAIACHKKFLKYTGGEKVLCKNIDADFIIGFKKYLSSKLKGDTISGYFIQFKRAIKLACKMNAIRINPLTLMERKDLSTHTQNEIRKDVLTINEISRLKATPTQNENIKNAFLFSCFTGLAQCDIENIKWSDIKETQNGLMLTTSRAKLNKPGKVAPTFNIHLHEEAVKLLGEIKQGDEKVFKLPTTNGVNKTLKSWAKRAKINKKVTYYVARHSFATNLCIGGADIVTSAELMGHSGLGFMTLYTHIAGEMKRDAINKLPALT